MVNDKITWAPHIPLIGGFPLGAELALGYEPEEIFSLPGFLGNDKHYVNYQQNTLGRSHLKYTPIDPDDLAFDRKINIIVGTPPCAALSMLNTGKSAASKGVGCAKNDFMMMVFEHGMKKFEADVIVVENAPALATTRGKPVADALYKICEANGYSLTLFKTSTHFHGIPQRRDRTFAIAWRSPTAPIMELERRPSMSFQSYIDEAPKGLQHNAEIINPKIFECGYWQFISATKGDPRKLVPESGQITCFNYVNKNGMLNECIDWLKENGSERAIRLAEHAKMKFEKGLGIWDGSVHVFSDMINAIIGRNMMDSVHPVEDRSLSIREAMHLMGLPDDFELLDGRKSMNHIAQNVSTCSARYIVEQAAKFVRGELQMSDAKYLKQDNWTGRMEVYESSPKPSLDDF